MGHFCIEFEPISLPMQMLELLVRSADDLRNYHTLLIGLEEIELESVADTARPMNGRKVGHSSGCELAAHKAIEESGMQRGCTLSFQCRKYIYMRAGNARRIIDVRREPLSPSRALNSIAYFYIVFNRCPRKTCSIDGLHFLIFLSEL